MRYNRAKYGRRCRDFQQSRVYRAEATLPELKFRPLEAVEGLVETVVQSRWFALHAPFRVGVIEVIVYPHSDSRWKKTGEKNGAAYASAGVSRRHRVIELFLPKRHWTDVSVLHELAHIASTQAHSAHGPAFVSRLVEIHSLFGQPGNSERLQASLRKTGARWSRDLWRKT